MLIYRSAEEVHGRLRSPELGIVPGARTQIKNQEAELSAPYSTLNLIATTPDAEMHALCGF